MKTVNFTSILSDEMTHFVKLKQHSGSDYQSSAKLLGRFDKHLVILPFNKKILTRSVFQNYFKTINHLCNKGFSNHYGVLRQFSEWFNQYEPDSYVLEKRSAIDRSYSRPAYIFSIDEIKDILVSSRSFTEKEEFIPGLYQTLFSLLYSTGMRISEVLALDYASYIKDDNLIHIRKGKFRKERYIVLSSSTANQLNKYIKKYNTILPLSIESPLFVNIRQRTLSYNSARSAFIKALKKSNIIKNNNGPKLHDFRHTFAVHRLLQWYKNEQNINAKLPYLSTYMGHVDIDSTKVYLETTSELLQAGNERFYRYFMSYVN